MTDTQSMTVAHGQPVIVTLPAEIDMANVDALGEQLAAAFCSQYAGGHRRHDRHHVLRLHWHWHASPCPKQATARGTEMRLLLPCPNVLRVMTVQGVDALLPIYHSLEEALAAPLG
jgi:hypothetical protein